MASFPIGVLALVIIACVILYQFLKVFSEMKGCWAWPAAEGQVVFSDIETRTRSHSGRLRRLSYPKVAYEYKVDGRNYRSERLYFGPLMGGSLAARIAYRYPVGRTVKVLYNPQNPSEAVLIRTAPSLLMLLAVAAVIAAFAFAGYTSNF